MKKIIFLFICLFLITGCYDYQELNDRAIVSGISIDFQEENYIINYEILNSEKSDTPQSEEAPNKAYLIEGMGKTVVEALENAADKVSKDIQLSHLKLLILSEEAAQNHLRDIVDYMLRNPNIRNIFSLVVAKGDDAKNILKNTSQSSPVVSENIDSLIRHNHYNENISIEIDFDNFMDQYEDKRIDPAITAIRLIEKTASLDGIAIFKGEKLQTILDKQNAAIYNLLRNESQNHRLKIPCEGKEGYTIMNLYQNNHTQYQVKGENLFITSKLNANVEKDSCGYDFRNPNIYPELNQKFAEVLNQEIKEFWNHITFYQTDILGVQKIYYQTTRQELESWQDLKLQTDIQIEINKNGSIFEVK